MYTCLCVSFDIKYICTIMTDYSVREINWCRHFGIGITYICIHLYCVHAILNLSHAFVGLICPYEMYSDNGTSLTPFSTPSGTTTIGNCRQQCDNLAICQAYTFAARTCKLYQTAPKDQTITAAAGSTLNIKKCIYPDGRVIMVHLNYKLLQPIKLDTCKHE